MKHTAFGICGRAVIVCFAAHVALAQQPAPTPPSAVKSTPQIDAGEPRANTVPGAQDAPAAEAASPADAAKPAARRNPKAAVPQARAAAGTAAQKGATAADRLNLNATTVTGDREQPKVMYVVPWKSPNIGDLSGKPMNSLLDEALAPVDREEFKREVVYYDAVRAHSPGVDSPKTDAAAAAGKQVER